ncbi:hypothetical protein [Sphingobacterium chungjuense]|uniref:hypothetical protein n=1 Tax=Sphingobacterium chungjuense TaxID=2675553 RepID=UPI00140C783C|nr:hypothetical protein [Sphingobacterium chungjuense]
MAKSIYDVLNIVDVYIEITQALRSTKPLYWEDIADIQQQIETMLENNALKSAIYKEVINLPIDSYQNLLETISIRRNQLLNVIDLFKIEHRKWIFEHKLDEQVARKQKIYNQQLSKTTAIRQEYESFDKSLEAASYRLNAEELSDMEYQNEREKNILKPFLDTETAKLDELFREYDSFGRENCHYTSAKHIDLLNYLDDILTKVFVREPVVSENKVLPLRNYDLVKIFESFGGELFDNVSEDDFLIVFQGGKINSFLNLKSGVFNKIYFLIHNLSEQINDEKKIGWVNHILSSIHWKNSPTNTKLLERIRQKRRDADKNFKNNLAEIISINPSELESPSRR